MRHIEVRLGRLGDVDDAVSVYERSNLARRQGDWPSRPGRVAKVTASLHDAALHDAASWFLIGRAGGEVIAMALIDCTEAADSPGQGAPCTMTKAIRSVNGVVIANRREGAPVLWGVVAHIPADSHETASSQVA